MCDRPRLRPRARADSSVIAAIEDLPTRGALRVVQEGAEAMLQGGAEKVGVAVEKRLVPTNQAPALGT